MSADPRYVIRPAESSSGRHWEIFDNQKRETLGSFQRRGKKDDGDLVVVGYAEELIKRLNAEHQIAVAAIAARDQLWKAVVDLSDEDAVRKQKDLQDGRAFYFPQFKP